MPMTPKGDMAQEALCDELIGFATLNGKGDLACDGDARPYINTMVNVGKRCKSGLYLIITHDGKKITVPKRNLESLHNRDLTMSKPNEVNKAQIKEAHAFLDKNILSYDVAIANIELVELVKWADTNLCNGAALHIIIEDGNYEDDCVEHCENYINSGEWDKDCAKHDYSYQPEDNEKMSRILELLKPLSEETREMLCNQTTITEDLFDLLYNQACQVNRVTH